MMTRSMLIAAVETVHVIGVLYSHVLHIAFQLFRVRIRAVFHLVHPSATSKVNKCSSSAGQPNHPSKALSLLKLSVHVVLFPGTIARICSNLFKYV